MRTWGRIPNPSKGDRIGIDFTIGESAIGESAKDLVWVEVDTDANGYNDAVFLTTLIQVLKLNLNESPFYASSGIPAKNSVLQQVAPDYYVNRTQQQFAGYFASLIVARDASQPQPVYNVSVITQQGSKLQVEIPT